MKLVKRYLLLATIISTLFSEIISAQALPENFINPPQEFSVMPFWFWNDTLKDDEIVRQIADFEAHGVYGFVIHPRIGLPENVKWLSTEMIHSMDVAIREASIRKMHVICMMKECILRVLQADRSLPETPDMQLADWLKSI